MKLRVLDLFSGIGGFSLGLERAGGFETVAFCEIEPYCRRVLKKHWPDVPCYEDVRTLTADTLRRDGIAVDVICGGFPCQDVSFAGKRAGLEGARSGLWREYARIIGELRPRFVIVENVPGLLNLGMGAVLGDLSTLGYGATWDCIPASAVGAPHRRDRVWCIAYANSERLRQQQVSELGSGGEAVAQSNCENAPNTPPLQRPSLKWRQQNGDHGSAEDVAYADGARPQGARHVRRAPSGKETGQSLLGDESVARQWEFEPDVGRVAHGVPKRVDRLRSLGNAVVPQIPELIGKAIMQAEGMTP